METARAINPADIGAAPRLHAADLHEVVTDSTGLQLEKALAQVAELERKLASSRLESTAAQQQLELLTRANSWLGEPAFPCRHEVARGPPQGSPTKAMDGLSEGLDSNAMERLWPLLNKRTRFRKGDQIYRVGDGFNALYLIHVGSCKTVLLARGGQDQIAGYHMPGEIIGLDGVATDIHECQAVALESMEVHVLPFDQVEALARISGHFQHNLHKLLAKEGARAQALMILLGTLSSEQRLGVFLLDLSQRYQARGYSSCEFVLRMTRAEIGSYLGLKLETVSRTFSRFQHSGFIQVQGRGVKLLDRVALSRVVDCSV